MFLKLTNGRFLERHFSAVSIVTAYLPKYFIDGILNKDLRLAAIAIASYCLVVVIFNLVGYFSGIPIENKKYSRCHVFEMRLSEHTFKVRQEHLESSKFYNEHIMRLNNLMSAVANVTGYFGSVFQQITAIISIMAII